MIVKPRKLSSAYVAGFIDGEGCIGISHGHGTSYFLLSVQITNTNREVLDLLVEKYGGCVVNGTRSLPGHKKAWAYSVDARLAEALLRDVFPHLVVKRRQAEVALRFRSLFRGKHILPRGQADQVRHAERRAETLSQRAACYDEMAVLNKRGVG